jgi:hypothetical protein
MTSPPPAGDSLDNPIFWHEFLKRLSFCDIEYVTDLTGDEQRLAVMRRLIARECRAARYRQAAGSLLKGEE